MLPILVGVSARRTSPGPIQFGDLATWLAALGTVGAVAVALVQIARERTERQRRDRERLIQERRAQAEKASVWSAAIFDTPMWLEFSNASDQPVYWAVVTPVAVQGAGPRTGHEAGFIGRAYASVVPPGRSFLQGPQLSGGMHLHFGFEMAFTDRAGRHWLREATGGLREIDQWGMDFYGQSLPVSWGIPRTDRPHTA